LIRFYEKRTYQPAWFNDNNPVSHVESLMKTIREAYLEGLRPYDYHLNKIEEIFNQIFHGQKEIKYVDPKRLADFDLLLTDSFLLYGFHLLSGRINPETLEPQWDVDLCEIDLADVLQIALDTSQIEKALRSLPPMYTGYISLRATLKHYRDIAAKGGWPVVPNGLVIRKGDNNGYIIDIRNRLKISGDLVPGLYKNNDILDDILEQALLKFQYRHGLRMDGIINRLMLAELNVSVEDRIRQIELNMERWRWLPRDLGDRYIIVNIADFKAGLFEGGRPVMTMKVVVGKNCHQTPVFSGKITNLVLSPYWYIPRKIAIRDILPLIRKDSDYFNKHHMKVFENCGGKLSKIDPKTIEWGKVNANNFKYRLRQDPGPWNSLGRIKFVFPNKFAVYLHDTPSQELFEKTPRTFSAGCIRLENPIELVKYLLQGDPDWTQEKIYAAINKNIEQNIPVPNPIHIHLLYWTAWANDDLIVQFRSDIYGRDKRLDSAYEQTLSIPQ
jgi:murein L,D-transpeptidase YcbB/YkuD